MPLSETICVAHYARLAVPSRLAMRHRLLAPTFCLLLAGCVGKAGDGPAPGGPDAATPGFTCDSAAVPATPPLRRLSRQQHRNAVGDLVSYLLPGDAPAIVANAAALFDAVPPDKREGPGGKFGAYTRLDQTVHQEYVDATYQIATFVGAELTASPSRLGAVAGDCATNPDAGDDDACLDDFIRRFGERALRRPVSDEDIAFYRAVAGAPPFDPPDYADVIGLLLTAPSMLYFVEHGTGDSAVVPVTSYELAARLSFHFWQTTPDEELLAAARSGALATPEGYEAQLDRLVDDPRTRASIASFFSEWLYREDLEELDTRLGTPVFDAFIGDFVPGPELRERMFAEVTDMALYYTFDSGGTFSDLFTSTQSFARTDDLATLYGVPVWDGTSPPPELPDGSRVGLLTRAALLATGSANTRPIMKGVFLRKAILCDEIPPPPANANSKKPELSKTYSTRQVVEQVTEQPGTVCAGCHAGFINPLGFATENFDALGRSRKSQVLYDPETGEVVGEAPIDTSSVPMVTTGETAPSKGAADLSRLMVESGKPQACFARQYFRFTFGRAESIDTDGCALAALHGRMSEGESLRDVLRSVALIDAFRMRSFDGQ